MYKRSIYYLGVNVLMNIALASLIEEIKIVSVTAIRVIYVIAELFYYEPINEFDEWSFT